MVTIETGPRLSYRTLLTGLLSDACGVHAVGYEPSLPLAHDDTIAIPEQEAKWKFR